MLIVFSQEDSDLSSEYKNMFEISYFCDFSVWEKEKTIPSAFIIKGKDKHYISSTLEKVRKDNEFFASLCFITDSAFPYDDFMLDGQLPQPADLREVINQFDNLSKSFKRSETYITHQGRFIK